MQDIIASDYLEANQGQSSIRLGLSVGLAGQKVRYKCDHTKIRLCLNVIGQFFSFNTFCSEVAVGFGTPRLTMRFMGNLKSPKLMPSTDAW